MAEVGEREKKDCPAAEGKGMTKYSPTFAAMEPCTLWGKWGEPKLSQKYLVVSKQSRILAGKQNLKETTKIQLKS